MTTFKRLYMHWFKFQPASSCEDCGAVVLVDNQTVHRNFHASLKAIASDLYGVSPEDM